MMQRFRTVTTLIMAGIVLTEMAWAMDFAGTVVDEAGKPVSGAKVMVRGPVAMMNETLKRITIKTLGESLSGDDGHFAVSVSATEGERDALLLHVLHPMYGIATASSRNQFSNGKTLTEFAITLPARGGIKGKVVDVLGKPIQDAEITPVVEGTPGNENYLGKLPIRARSGSDGVFLLDGLSSNTRVVLRATHANYAPGFIGTPGAPDQLGLPVPVGSTEAMITLQPGSALEGRIRWEGTHEPVTHHLLVACPDNVDALCTPEPVETDANGFFSLTNLVPGKYFLRSLFPLPEGVMVPQEVIIEKQSRKKGLELVATKGVRIGGKLVRSDTGEPVGSGSVLIQRNDFSESFRVKVGEDGRFEGRSLPGPVSLQINALQSTINDTTRLLVPGSDQTDLVYTVHPLCQFTGKVLDPDGRPVAGARVFSRFRDLDWVTTNQEGVFTYPITSLQSQINVPVTYLFEAYLPEKPGLRGYLFKSFVNPRDLTGDIQLVSTGSIQGRVLKEGTGEAVPHRLVTAYPDDFNSTRLSRQDIRGMSDAQGYFHLDNLWPGTYTLIIKFDQEGVAFPKKIDVKQGDQLTGQDITVVRGNRISGRVVDADTRAPVGFGLVSCSLMANQGAFLEMGVNSNGIFEGYMPSGVIYMNPRIPDNGYRLCGGSQKTIRLEEGQEKNDVVFDVISPIRVKGHTVGKDGKPISGACISITAGRQNWNTDRRPAISNHEGYFEISIPINPDTPSDLPIVFDAWDPEKTALRGILKKKITRTDSTADIVLLPAGSVQGKVVWENSGKPAARMALVLNVSEGDSMPPRPKQSCFFTDDQGCFTLGGVLPGSYSLSAVPNQKSSISPFPIDIASGEQKRLPDLLAVSCSRISGKLVKAGTSDAVEGGSVSIFSSQNRLGVNITVRDGLFACFVPPGQYSLNANSRYGSLSNESAARQFTVLAGQDQTDIPIEIKPYPVIRGKVSDMEGKPVGGARVNQANNTSSFTTNAEGMFEVTVVNQRFSRQSESASSCSLLAFHPDKPDCVGVADQPLSGDNEQVVDIVLKPAGCIQGTICFAATGKPACNLPITARLKGNTPDLYMITSLSAITDDAGMFRFNRLVPGVYSLKVNAFDTGVVQPMEISIAQGEQRTDLKLQVVKGIRMTGQFVKKGTREGVPGGYLNVNYLKDQQESKQIRADSEGRFEALLNPGQVSLNASISNGSSLVVQNTRNLTLVEGQDQTDIFFEVRAPFVFHGRVFGPDQKPVSGAQIHGGGESQEPVVSDSQGEFTVALPKHVTLNNGSSYSLGLTATLPSHPEWKGVVQKNIASESDLTGDILMVSTGQIQGSVVWEGTGAPLKHVTVTAQPVQQNTPYFSGASYRMETDASGKFVFKQVLPGRYCLKLESMVEGVFTPRTLDVTPETSGVNQDIVVSKGIKISGRIVQAGSTTPAANVSLTGKWLADPNNLVPIPVKADGTFEGYMKPGNVVLTTCVSAGRLRPEDKEKQITLVEGKALSDLVIEVLPSLSFKGHVLDGDGKPVGNAKVILSYVPPVVSKPDGSFEVILPQYLNDAVFMDFSIFLEATSPDNPKHYGQLRKKVTSESDLTGDIVLQKFSALSGQIIWDETGVPLKQASVSMKRTSPESSDGKTTDFKTDDSGRFCIESITPGKYQFELSSTSEGILVPNPVEIIQGIKPADLLLRASKGALVSGRFVKAGTTDPVSEGRLEIDHAFFRTAHTSIQANSDGTFSVRLLPGTVTLHASHPKGTLLAPKRTLQLLAGQDQANILFEVGAPAVFKGRIIGMDGKPVEGASITARELSGNDHSSLSDKEGLFEMTLPYYWQIPERGSTTLTFRVSHRLKPELRSTFCKKISQKSDLSGDILLAPAGSVEGKVFWKESGEPIGACSVLIKTDPRTISQDTGFREQTRTDATGAFSFDRLPAGKYAIVLEQFTEGVSPVIYVEVKPGEKQKGTDLLVSKGVRITGKFVKADTGEGIRGGYLYMQMVSQESIPIDPIQIRPDGSFETRVNPGRVELNAQVQSGYLPADQAHKTLTLVAGQDPVHIVYEVKPPLIFKGRVLDSDGKPVAQAKVRAPFYNNGDDSLLANKDGVFDLPIPSGVTFSDQSLSSLMIRASHPEMPDMRGVLVKKIKNESELTGDIVLRPGGVIQGRVVDKKGNPIPSAMIETSLVSVGCYSVEDIKTTSNALGEFELKPVLPEMTYNISIRADGYGYANNTAVVRNVKKPYGLGDQTLLLTDQILEGVVLDEAEQPVSGAEIHFNGNSSHVDSVRSDEQGHFHLEGLAAETGELSATYTKGEERQSAHEQVAAGDANIVLYLAAELKNFGGDEEDKKKKLIDKPAPSLELSAWLQGEATTLEALRGQPVVLAFCSGKEDAAKEVLDLLNRLHAQYPDLSMVMVFNYGTDPVVIQKIMEGGNRAYRVAIDGVGVTRRKYNARVPALYLIDAKGLVRYQDLAFSSVEQAAKSMIESK